MQTAAPTLAPQPGPQTAFMATPADICVFGGQAWKVFEKYDLYYDLTFDAAPVADFKTRR